MTSTIDAPRVGHDGISSQLIWLQSTKNRPTLASRNSGVSLSVASTVIARAPSFTPNAFSAIRIAYRTTMNSVRKVGSSNCGQARATCRNKAEATAPLEAALQIHIKAPAMNPGNGPNAAAT